MGGTTRNAANFFGADAGDGWVRHRGDVYRFPVHLSRVGDGYRAIAATVPAVAGSGPTEELALSSIRVALAAAIVTAKGAGSKLPKSEPTPLAPGAVEKVVIVRLADHG